MTPLLRWRPLLRRAPHWPAPDFLGGRPRVTALTMAALLAAVATLGVCALDVATAQSRIDEAAAQLARWQQHAAPSRRTALPEAGAASPASRTLQALRRGAGHPWPLLFSGVESVSAAAGEGGIAWLALEHDRERPDVRLEGVARNAGLVLKLVDGLAAEAGWSHVVLTRLADAERADTLSPGVRFEITGQLDGNALAPPPLALVAPLTVVVR